MSGIDATIPLGVKTPDTTSSLSNIMGLARGALQLQLGRVELQKNEIALGERKGIQELFSQADQFKGDDGQIDWNRFIEAGMKVAPTTFPTFIPQVIQATKAGTEAKQALSNLNDATRASAGQWFLSQVGRPYEDVSRDAADLKKLNPALAPAIDNSLKLLDIAANSPLADNKQAAMDATVKRLGMAAMSPPQQAAAMTPSGVQVANGQQTKVVNTNPMAMPVGATVPGTEQQMQLPPTTQVFNPEAQAPGYLGPQGAAPAGAPAGGDLAHGQPPPNGQVDPATQQVRDTWRKRAIQNEIDNVNRMPDGPVKRDALAALNTELNAMEPKAAPVKTSFVQSGPKLGTEANVAGTVDVVNKDWSATAEQARTASQDIGVLQNIKKYARGAVTGVGNDRRAYLAGLAGLIGMGPAQLEKTDTDLLAKNSNMLALAGGDTNLAKLMAESANPNPHMTPEAIESAANQVIAQRRLALAKQSYMQHFKGDPEQYTKELAAFNQVADPRVLQLPDMSREEMARMKAAMSESERKAFGGKIRKMQAMGLVQ